MIAKILFVSLFALSVVGKFGTLAELRNWGNGVQPFVETQTDSPRQGLTLVGSLIGNLAGDFGAM